MNLHIPDEALARQAADGRERREIWNFRLTIIAAILSLGAVVFGGLNWFSPREPTPAKIDPNFIYKNGSAIGHIKNIKYRVAPGDPNINIDVDRSEKIFPNDVIDVSGKRCAIISLNETGLNLDKLTYSYHIFCRLI